MVYHTKAWLRFVAETQRAEPVVAQVCDGESVVGDFYGLIFRRYGLRLFGSPFVGWTTSYMGFSLQEGVPRSEAARLVPAFVFRELGCVHLEMIDRSLTDRQVAQLGFDYNYAETYETDLTQPEDEIFSSMKSACRRCIRKATKSGVVIEEGNPEGFAGVYYDQLQDVFDKQTLVPTYDLERVDALIKWLFPTGDLLLLRARDPDGNCIATGIYVGRNDLAQFWGNASYREHQILRPNEALHWHAMRHWKARGARVFDWGGGGTYKEKYGCTMARVPRIIVPRYRFLLHLRNASKTLFSLRQRLLGRLRSRS